MSGKKNLIDLTQVTRTSFLALTLVLAVVLIGLWFRGDNSPEIDKTLEFSAQALAQPQVRNGKDFDLSITSIPADQILRGGPKKDGIPAISNPKFVPAGSGDFMKPNDRVIGVVVESKARAYPIRVLNYHEIINDEINGVPIAITYCPLCDSVSVFDRRTPDGTREFGVSGLLFNSNVLMYDRGGESENLWSQLMATGVSGKTDKVPLRTLPVSLTSWKEWRNQHPDTELQSLDTGFNRDYSQSPYRRYFESSELMFSVNHKDDRLPPRTKVIGAWTSKSRIAIPETLFAGMTSETTIQAELDGMKFAVRFLPESQSMLVTEADPGLQWMYSFWFAWSAFHPSTQIYPASAL
ncbi:MAG: DUF3179 domain-containing protein [Planctomyces sp.]|nr:DUF3179 domain-containing protein [Planctomyces sp.]